MYSDMIKVRNLDIIKYQNIMRNFAPEING